MKLLFIAESFPSSDKTELTGGVEAGDYYISKELAQRHQVYVITLAKTAAPRKEVLNNITIFRVGLATEYYNRESFLARISFFLAAIATARKIDFELVHGSNVYSQLVAALISLMYRKPAIAKIADVYMGNWIAHTNLLTGIMGEIIERLVLFYPWHQMIAWSNTTQKKINKLRPKLQVEVIGGGIDTSNIKTSVIKYSKPTLVAVGRLVSYKRVDNVLNIFHQVRQTLPCHLVIVGSGSEFESLKTLAQKLGIQKDVKFTGFIASHQAVIEQVKRSHVLIHASTVEGFGLVTLEAAACGIPFVHSDLEVTREITQNGQGGFFFQIGDIDQAASQVTTLLTDKKLYNQKVAEGKKLANHYSWSQVARRTEQVFKKIAPKKA